MKRKLSYKICIRVMRISSISIVILGLMLSGWGIKFLKEQRRELIDREVYPISVEILNYLRAQENVSLDNLKNMISIISKCTNSNIIVTDNLGYPYIISDYIGKENSLKLSEKIVTDDIRNKLKVGNVIEKFKEIDNGESSYIYMKPIFQEDYFGGVLIFETSTLPMKVKTKRLLIIIWLCILVSIIIMQLSIKYYIERLIIKPVSEINNAARKIVVGESDKRVSIESDDEIGELAKSFNLMAESLNETDINMKEFISNASHELRSPITSIRGFIACMMDGIIHKDKEKYYLNIVYDEIKRLSRLVDDLLDISTLGNSNYTLNKTENDINGMIKLCLDKQETRIIDKDLKVEVTLEKKHEFVFVDRDRIIQVIINLLDNAIKYSDSGEIIRIKTETKGEKVYVSIENRGLGLSETDLAKIWDRFYKSDASRTNKESTGLGLPIVRSILSRHGEDIWVESNNGVTIFTFTLTKVL